MLYFYFQKYLLSLVCALPACMYVCITYASLVLTKASVGVLDSLEQELIMVLDAGN